MGRRNRHRKGISIHTPLAGSDRAASGLRGLQAIISIHTPLAGSDQARQLDDLADRVFQSTLPLRGATHCPTSFNHASNISIHTPLAGSDAHGAQSAHFEIISIHTPLAGSDRTCHPALPRRTNFNPHSPCGERRSTSCTSPSNCNFNPHSPCGERLHECRDLRCRDLISIHTPLAGSDWPPPYRPRRAHIFQSTLPLRGATAEMRHF